MTRLDDALARFSAALERLESCVEEGNARAQAGGDLLSELTLLKAERDRMFTRIAALEEDSRMLAGLTEEVEDRLDSAISEIRDVLGRN